MLHRPLIWSALGFATGILASSVDLPSHRWGLLASVALGGSLAILHFATTVGTLRLASIILCAGFVCLGRLAAVLDENPGPTALAVLLDRHPVSFSEGVDLTARLARPPDDCPDRYPQAPCQDLHVEILQVRLSRIPVPVTGTARLRLPGAPEDSTPLARGDVINAFARLSLPGTYRNEGAFDRARYLRARGIHAIGSIKSRRLVTRVEPSDPPTPARLMRVVDSIRFLLLERIDTAFPETARGLRARAVAKALLLGERRELDPADNVALQKAGVSHLLAVSGFNVAVLAIVLFLLLRCLRLSSRTAAATVIPVLLLYLLLNRDESSVARAVTMAVTYLGGRLIWRRPDPFNTLGLAALLILVPAPAQIHDPGFQLTFLATAPLILVSRRSAMPVGNGAGRWRPTRWLLGALIVTLAAMIGTLPLTVLHFNRVTPGGAIANLLAAPLMACVFVTVILLELVSAISESGAEFLARVIILLVDPSFWIAELIGQVPWLSYRRITPGLLVMLVYYGGLVATVARWSRSHRLGFCSSILTGLATLALLLPLDTRRAPEGLRVTVLDVGQGDSLLLESRGGTRVLVDAGAASPTGFDIGERVVSRALWDMGIASLDILVVTHGHSDHAGGAAAVIRNFNPREVWLPVGAGQWRGRWVAARLEAALEEAGLPRTEVSRGVSRCLGGARLEVLHPSIEPDTRRGNEGSVVLRFAGGGRAALLSGDAGSVAETRLRSEKTRASLLKVGHHGSRTASSAAFLRAVNPDVAVISCGRRNRFGHPHDEVLRRLHASGTRICRTDLEGVIQVELLPGATRLDPSCAGIRTGP